MAAGYVIVGETAYKCAEIETGLNSISFTFAEDSGMTYEKAEAAFINVTSLQTGAEIEEDGSTKINVHGTYDCVKYSETTGRADGTIVICMYIPDETERRLLALEEFQTKTQTEQAIQNAALMELASLQ